MVSVSLSVNSNEDNSSWWQKNQETRPAVHFRQYRNVIELVPDVTDKAAD